MRTITHDHQPTFDAGNHFDKCTVCGETAVESIPALKDKTAEPAPENQENEEQENANKLNPVVIAVAAALVILGIVILIFGKKREKK